MLRALPPLSKSAPIRHPTSILSAGRQCPPPRPVNHPQTTSFSQIARLNNQPDPKSRRSNPSEPEGNPSFPSISLKDLGANRAVKYTVYTVLGVLGTMETIFWTKTIWRYFSPAEEEQDGGES